MNEWCKLLTIKTLTEVNSRGGVEDTRLEAKDTKKIRGQSQGQPFRGPRPRTQAQVLSKKKKRSSQIFFKRSPQKNVFQKIFQALHKILTIQKIVLSSSRGQANFRGLEAKDFKMCPRGLHLWLTERKGS